MNNLVEVINLATMKSDMSTKPKEHMNIAADATYNSLYSIVISTQLFWIMDL